MLLSDYTLQVQELVHDLSNLDYSQTELTSFVNQGRQRVALDLHCVRSFFTGLSFITSQEVYPMSSGIGGCVLTNGGSGYNSAPAVNIGPPPAGGIQATAVAVLAGPAPSAVGQIQMTNWGFGYTTIPAVSLSGGGGSSATAIAIAMTNVLDINSITVLTQLLPPQRFMLDWLPFSMFQAFFRASQLTQSYPGIWTSFEGNMPAFGPNIVNQVNPFLIAPTPNQTYFAEIDAVIQIDSSNFLVNPTDVDNQIFQPNSDAVQYYAAYKALLKTQNFEHAEKIEAKYMRRIQEIQPSKRTRRIPNIYRNSYRRIARWMG